MRKKQFTAGVVLVMLATCLTACNGKQSSDAQTDAQQGDAAQADAEQGEAVPTEATASTEDSDYVDTLDRSEQGLTLVWNDEFDGDSLDTTKWSYQYGTGSQYGLDDWGNSEQEYYTDRPENIKVEDGRLVITAIKEEDGYEGKPYTSGRIRTVTDDGDTLFATTYGRVEARIKMPAGEGIWPAFWMLPVDETIYGGWAASGEIDIMEARGRLPGQVGGTLHYGKNWPNNTYKGQDYFFAEDTDITDYHVYTLEWEPDEIRWSVDDECYYSMDNWYSQGKAGATDYAAPAPFDVPFYVLLNMAVGGTFDSEANLDNAEYPAQMEVDYVRVYAKDEGYEFSPTDTAATDSRDTESFDQYAAEYTDGEYITDQDFATLNLEAITDTDKGIVPESKDWQFAVGNFGGAASASLEELEEGTFAKIDVTGKGNQTYAIQLIQHLPIIEGYSYQVSFDAKASDTRTFIVSPSGDADNGWGKYGAYEASVGTDMKNYSFIFKMNAVSDPTARLEFNLGNYEDTVWIGNVSVSLVMAEGGYDDDMKKVPVYAGNLIYNGTFDQGADRLAFWHAEDMEAAVVDYVIAEDGTQDFSRMADLTATGAVPCLYQKGIQLASDQEYYLQMELSGTEDATVQIRIANSDGTVSYYEDTCSYTAADGKKEFEFTFTTPQNAEDENATFEISLPEGMKISVDGITMHKKL